MPMGMPLLRRRLHVPADPLPRAGAAHPAGARRAQAAQCDRTGGSRDGQRAGRGGNRRCSGRRGRTLVAVIAEGRLYLAGIGCGAWRSGGTRSVTIAPEAGSERMRKVINKNLTEPEILRAASMMVGEGVENLKLYFMVGLPEEHRPGRRGDRAADRQDSGPRPRRQKPDRSCNGARLIPSCPSRGRHFSGIRWKTSKTIKDKMSMLRSLLSSLGGVELDAESPREGYFQTLVSRGDRRVGGILQRLHRERCEEPGEIWQSLRQISREAMCANPGPLPNPERLRLSPLQSRRSCCRGTLSTTASRSGFCCPNARRPISSIRPSPATSPDAPSAAPANCGAAP